MYDQPETWQGDAVMHVARIDRLAGIESLKADFKEAVIGNI
jgi:hypothetical protein